MKIEDIIKEIENVAPLSIAASFDNSGLLVGDAQSEVSSALVSLDVTEDVVAEAKELGCGIIISHHPLIFSGLKKICGSNYIERCVIELIKNNIALYCCHTPLDASFEGMNFKLGEKLGLKKMEILSVECKGGEGFGVVGELESEVDFQQFLRNLKGLFATPAMRITAPHKKNVKKIALCSGSGASFINRAIEVGAELYISGDFKYHDFFLAENRITLADIGHFESEKIAMDIFCDIISKKYTTFALYKTKVNSNPIIYL